MPNSSDQLSQQWTDCQHLPLYSQMGPCTEHYQILSFGQSDLWYRPTISCMPINVHLMNIIACRVSKSPTKYRILKDIYFTSIGPLILSYSLCSVERVLMLNACQVRYRRPP